MSATGLNTQSTVGMSPKVYFYRNNIGIGNDMYNHVVGRVCYSIIPEAVATASDTYCDPTPEKKKTSCAESIRLRTTSFLKMT